MLECKIDKSGMEVEMEGYTAEILTDMTLLVARVLLDLMNNGAIELEGINIKEFLDVFLEEEFKHNLGEAMVKLMIADAVEDMM